MTALRAVVFDLYDTVVFVDPVHRERHQEDLAKRLGLPPDLFLAHWRGTGRASNLGTIGPTEDRFREVIARGGAPRADLGELAATEHAFLRAAAKPVSGIRALLRELRSGGVRLGLLSNCSASVSFTLEAAGFRDAFDAVSLSCETGLAKPDPRFFRRLLAELDVEPAAALYVADGVDGELEAAEQVGMTAVRAAWANPGGSAHPRIPVATSVDALSRIIAGRRAESAAGAP